MNNKLRSIIRKSTPKESLPQLTHEQIEKLKKVSHVLLAILAGAGILAVAAVAPNAVQVIDKIFVNKSSGRKFSKREKDDKIYQSFYYLKKSGMIKMRPTMEDYKVFLTNLGKRRVKELNFETLTVSHGGKWDGKWWEVAADIPTKKYKYPGDILRLKLKQMNFYRLQKSVWFYPYDPKREINHISKYYRIGSYVTLMEVNRLDKDDESKMMEFFKKREIL